MSDDNHRLSIKPLDGSNWMTWKIQMKHLLLHKGLWEHVTGDAEQPAGQDQLVKFRRAAQKANTTLYLHVVQSQIYVIGDEDNPAVTWKKLSDHFERGTLMTELQLQKQYFKCEMQEGALVQEHIKEMREMAEKLVVMQSPVSEEDKVMTLLGSLSSSYDLLVATLGAQVGNMELSTVERSLLDEEARRVGSGRADPPGAVAMYGRTVASANGKKPHYSGRLSTKGKCYLCKRMGHFQHDCPKKKAGSRSVEHQARVAATENKEVVFIAKPDKIGIKKSRDWIIDSGASQHMTWDRGHLEDYHALDKPELVRLGDNHVVEGEGIGNVQIHVVLEDGRVENSVLCDVFYIKELAVNLMSVSATTNKGYDVLFNEDTCRILDTGGKIVCRGIKEGNLWKLLLRSAAHSAALAHEGPTLADVWHQRLGHINEQTLTQMLKRGTVTGIIGLNPDDTVSFCKGCTLGKMVTKPFEPVGEARVTRRLQAVHSDVCGPITPKSTGGSKYFVTFTDEYSRATSVYFMTRKSEVLDKFREFEATVVGETGQRIGTLRTDNGTEFVNQDFARYLQNRQINHETSAPYTPQQNGIAERVNRTLVEKARALMLHAGLAKSYWAEAVATAAYMKNRTPTRSLVGDITPYERWYGRKCDVSRLRVFGCTAYARLPAQLRQKLDDRAHRLRFIGYDKGSKGYRLMDDETKKVHICRDVVFNETDFGETNHRTVLEPETSDDEQLEELVSQDKVEERNRPRRQTREPNWYGDTVTHYAFTADECEPQMMSEALKTPDADAWKAAAEAELESLTENHAWELMALPPGKKTVGCRWVFKVKRKEGGSVDRYKCHLVAKGYSQRPGIDYDETFSPVVMFTTIQALITYATQRGMLIHQMDIVIAFLNGQLDEEIYMDQPEGFEEPGKERLVCRLQKSLYGLKQAPRCWNRELQRFLISEGFTQSQADPCLFYHMSRSGSLVIIAVYVDDLIIAADRHVDIRATKKKLMHRFKMKDFGPLSFILGIGVQQDRIAGTVTLHQRQYMLNLLSRYRMSDVNPVSTPADVNVKLVKNDGVSKPADRELYQSLVGSLLYAAVATRPDIAQVVSAVAKYTAAPSEAHMTAARRILKYLKETSNMGLIYHREGEGLHAYSDADWAGDQDDRRSTTGNVVFLAEAAISLLSKKQPTIALSTTGAEYIALSPCTQEVVWIRRLLRETGDSIVSPTRIFEDNQGAIKLARNPGCSKRTRHIDIRFHFTKEAVAEGIIKLVYCHTMEMTADLLTKPIPCQQFKRLREKLGIKNVN